jgi:hypothetical protein
MKEELGEQPQVRSPEVFRGRGKPLMASKIADDHVRGLGRNGVERKAS